MTRWLDSRIGGLAVIVAVVALALAVAFDAWASVRADREDLALVAERTALLEARAAAITRNGSDNQTGAEGWLISTFTSGLASAEFQRRLADIAESSGGLVRSLDMREIAPVSGNAADQLVRLRLEADMEVLEEALPDLLHAIETSVPLMVIDSLVLRPNRGIALNASAGANPSADRPLNLRLAVSAFWTPEAPSR